MLTGNLYLNGQWILGEGEKHATYDLSFPETTTWQGHFASPAQVDAAVVFAKEALCSWALTSFEKRQKLLHHYKTNLEHHRTSLAEAISQSVGKPLWESHQEVNAMIGKIDISIQAYLERTPSKELSDHLKVIHKPHGIVVIFSPFNFPGHLINAHLVPALLAGNVVIVKGSEKTPLVTEMIASILDRCAFPKGVIQFLQGGCEVGKALCSNPQINALFFTGSSAVGQMLQQQITNKLLVLEMGGNNPLIVSKIKDPTAAAWVTIQSAFLTAGQRCTCARRLIINEKTAPATFLNELIAMTQQIIVDDFRNTPEPFMGPVIDCHQAHLLLEYETHLKSKGGSSLIPLRSLKPKLSFLSPGIIDVTDIASVEDMELFGPLLQVKRVSSFEEALCAANATAYGLSASLLSTSEKEFALFEQQVNAGVLNWNTPTCGASSLAPFGGWGKSGNYHPSGYYAADYCAYPVAQQKHHLLALPTEPPKGMIWKK